MRTSDKNWDWGGRLEERFRWSKLRFEWGRMMYRTNCFGDTTASKWQWEKE